MRQKSSVLFLMLTLSLMLAAPSILHAEDQPQEVINRPITSNNSYIDELARQVQQDIESGAIKDKVKPVDTSSQTTTTAPTRTQPRSEADRELDQLHLARFFGTIMGPDEFATDEFWEGPSMAEITGSQSFGDSVRNPTLLDLFGSGSGRVRGVDTDFNRPMSVNDPTLRDAINNGDFATLGQRLGELGFRTEQFRIEPQ